MAEKDVKIKVTADTAQAKAGLDGVKTSTDNLTDSQKNVASASDKVKKSSSGAANSISALGASAKGFVTVALAQQMTRIVASFQNMQRMMVGLYGSTQEAKKQFEFLTKTANRLGVDVESLSGSYTLLAAATRGTSLEGAAAQKIFSAFAGAMAQMGASTAEIEGAMVQLSQGISKGRFELEDVKSIMEKIPGSAAIFAESLGLTTKEFFDLISAGKLGRAEIEKIAEGLEKVSGKDDIEGLSQSWNKFVNELKLATVGIDESTGVSNALSSVLSGTSKVVQGLSAAIGITSDGFKALGQTIGVVAGAVVNLSLDGLKDALKEIGGSLTDRASRRLQQLFLGYEIAANRAGNEQSKTSAKLDEFKSAVLDNAGAYLKAHEAAANAANATKDYGNAQVSAAQAALTQAQATGTVNDVLEAKARLELASAKTAQDNAAAAQNLVDITQKRIDAIRSEIVALESKKAATDAEALQQAESIQKLKEEQVELDKLQPKQIAAAANLSALALAQAEQARQSQATADAMRTEGDNYDRLFTKQQQAIQTLQMLRTASADRAAADVAFVQIQTTLIELEKQRADAMQGTQAQQDAYSEKVAAAQEQMNALQAVMAGGVEAENALAAATTNAANATAQATAAQQQRAAALEQQSELSQLQYDLDLKNNDLKRIELQRRMDVAKARGNEAEVQRVQNDLYRLEIERIKIMAAAKGEEVKVMMEKIRLAEMEADLDGSRTETEQRTIAIAQQKLAIIQAEQQAYLRTADAKKEVLYATQSATQAEAQHAQAASVTKGEIQGQASAKRSVEGGGGGGGGTGAGGLGQALTNMADKMKAGLSEAGKAAFDESLKNVSTTDVSGMSTNSITSVINIYERAQKAGQAVDNRAAEKANAEKDKAEREARAQRRQQLQEEADRTGLQAPSRVVRFELSSPSGQKFNVDAVGGSDQQLEAWLKSLESGRASAQ